MKISAFIFFGIILCACGCNNTPKATMGTGAADSLKQKQDATNLNGTMKKLDIPSQVFTAPGDNTSLVIGKKGTAIFLVPADLETEEGTAPGGNVIVELKELSTQEELAKANAQTMSNGNLLISGGAYYINMTSEGKQLKLKKDKMLKVAFPKFTDTTMNLYYGQRDGAGQMNWLPSSTAFTAKNGYRVDLGNATDNKSIMVYNPKNFRLMGYVGNENTYRKDTASLHSIKKEAMIKRQQEAFIAELKRKEYDSLSAEKQKLFIAASKKLNESLYDITNIKSFGWINCDRLYPQAVKTNITYTIAPKDSILVAHVYLVFKEFNSMVNSLFMRYNYAEEANNGTRSLENCPVGYHVRLIAVTNRNNELLTCKMDLTIENNQHTLIVWRKTTPEELNSYFDIKNNWGAETK
jgi:hypothetical protein